MTFTVIDLYKLQIFTIVAQEGSFSAAAERLYITQSAISQHVKELEAQLGGKLFERGRRGVTLTVQGTILLGYARKILALVAQAEIAVTNVEQLPSGTVRIGATPGIAVYLAPEWVTHFRTRYPHLTAALQTGITAQVVQEVLSQHIDIGFVEGELENFQHARLGWLPLQEIEQHVIIGTKHPFWDRSDVELTDLNKQSFIMRPPNSHSRIWLDNILRLNNIAPTVGAEFDNLESIKRTVANGVCLTILPEYVVRQEIQLGVLRAVAIRHQPFKRTLKLLWDQETHFTPITRALFGLLQERFPIIARLLATQDA